MFYLSLITKLVLQKVSLSTNLKKCTRVNKYTIKHNKNKFWVEF